MTLVIGYGNPGREDDGLGPEFVRRLAEKNLPGVEVVTAFQLSVEHALAVASASCVVFVDASLNQTVPFALVPADASDKGDVSSHSLAPSTVLALARLHFDATPPAYILAISGRSFGRMHEGLSPVAQKNLIEAERFFLDWLSAPKAVAKQISQVV